MQVAQLSPSELERAWAMPVLMKASLFSRIADEDVLASDVDVAAATWASIKLVGHRHRELDRVPVEVDPRQTPSAAGEGGTVGHWDQDTLPPDQPARPLPSWLGPRSRGLIGQRPPQGPRSVAFGRQAQEPARPDEIGGGPDQGAICSMYAGPVTGDPSRVRGREH